MTLEGVELWRLDLRLARPVGTSSGTHLGRPVIYVHLVADDAEGWGESAALPAGTAVDPPHEAVWGALRTVVVPALLGDVPAGSLPTSPTLRAAQAAVEMARSDLWLRRRDRSLAAHFGVRAGSKVEVGTVIGIPDPRAVGSVVAAAASAASAGYRRVRVKIAPGFDREPLRAVRAAHPGLALAADANGAYRLASGGLDDAAALEALDELALSCIEQPLAPHDLAGHARLARRIATPVALDESVWSPERLEAALEARAAGVVCVKPERFGSLEGARQAVARCAAAGVATFVGGFFETGLARAANLAVAALPGPRLPGDLSDPATYLVDPCGYPAVRDGLVGLPSGPGVGPAPESDQLRALGGVREWFPAASA